MTKGSGTTPKPVATGLPAFDPNPSARFGHDLLTEVGVSYVLVGRVAMWALLGAERGEFTKDVDFAIPSSAIEPTKAALARRGIVAQDLPIGGIAIRHGEIRVDFIDRSEGGLNTLYEEAIVEAKDVGQHIDIGGIKLPLVTAEYLVAMKIASAELRDQRDAVKIMKVLGQSVDLKKTRHALRKHGGPVAANLLDALAREAGHPDARPEYRNGG